MKLPIRYIPFALSRKDRKKQVNMLKRSRSQYKKGKYYTRKPVKSFHSKTSKHIGNAQSIYKVNKITPNAQLAKATGCSIRALRKIVNKGEGAYFSSGSRPNQTAQSWGLARLASSITGGKAAAVDFDIIDSGCDHSKRAYKMALTSRRRNNHGQAKTKKTRA
jgi:hypothetical protein